jgi:Flp pilus assembly protein TadD
VINKMLTDLDQRQADASGAQPRRTGKADGEIQGAVPLVEVGSVAVGGNRGLLSVVVVILVVAAVGVWYWQNKNLTEKPPMKEQVAQVMAMATPQPAVSMSAPTPAPVSPKVATTPPAVVSQPALAPKLLPRETLASSRTVSDGVNGAVQNNVDKQKNSKVQAEPAEVAVTSPPATVTTAMNAVAEPAGDSQGLRMDSKLARLSVSNGSGKAQQQQPVTNEHSALSQAQLLWSTGSHVAAIELLQQALAHLESNEAALAAVTGQSPLAQVARELARMNLAEGQVRQSLALLTRLEPQLSQVADLWAMRGNAAQRLGQHAEAVRSYKQALLLKPDEPRWMAGQAVSLAAQGQTAAAAELAESARSSGALRPEVATYLRQLGVSIRAD